VSFFQWRVRQVADPDWSCHVAALAMQSDAPVVPVRFAGRNPWWFQLPGMFHPLIRTALILPAFLAGRGQTLRCAAGPVIRPGELAGLDADSATAYLRAAVARIPFPSLPL
jgi:putative hemolysin